MHQLDYDDNSFDLIVSGWTLRYSNNVYKALSEILRVIKPGGLVSIGFTYASKADKEKILNQRPIKQKTMIYISLIKLRNILKIT